LQNAPNAAIVRPHTKEAALRILGSVLFFVGLMGCGAPALAVDALAENGSAKLAAYQVCHPLATVDMGSAGSQSSTECNGIVKNLDSQHLIDNLAIHCLESTSSREDGYWYSGACVQTDYDGDKLYMSYEGSKSGQIKWLGGTGKYQDLSGAGPLTVVVAPASGPSLFAYTLNYDVTWTHKPK
jgi:hypothetical protein